MKKIKGLKSLLASAVCATLFVIQPAAIACTALHLKSKDNGVVVGRTMEFGVDVQSDVVVVPAGTKLTSSLPNKADGIHYTTKYGIVGANFMNKEMLVDGINEKGMYVGALYLPGYASYPKGTNKNAAKSMAPEDYVAWLLGNFKNVAEVKANYNKVILVQNPQKEIGGQSFPGHFLITDKSGATIVIEPTDNTLKLFNNPLGVLTNSPTFDWHMTNLSNYINLSATNVKPLNLTGTEIKTFGQGSGLVGLPGDYTPPSRFVRAVAFSQSAPQQATAKETVPQVFHIMNAFDIPYGVIQDRHKDGIHYDYTVWTSVSDLKNLKYAFNTYKDMTIRSIDVHKALKTAGNKIKVIEMDSKQPIKDISTQFK
ncbi:MAG: choloylglycine hydrolase family protein [Psychromonas sp.]|nr:choloylglycine hydrolase family protein [Psychromonas sp.]